MDVRNTAGGSLQISTDVLAKIARLARSEEHTSELQSQR